MIQLSCGSYNLTNVCAAVIWPTICDTSGNKLWDGRNYSSWTLDIGQSITVRITADAGRSVGDIVCAGADVQWTTQGDPCRTDVQITDQNVTTTAYFQLKGTVDNFELDYMGNSEVDAGANTKAWIEEGKLTFDKK